MPLSLPLAAKTADVTTAVAVIFIVYNRRMVKPVASVPVVDCLVLDDGPPYLVGNRCDGCGAVYLERRSACANCVSRAFTPVPLPETGRIESFTIVHRGAPKHIGPFISVLVRLDDGTYVRANLVGVPADPTAVDVHEPVRLVTYPVGTDDDGTDAVAFGFSYDGEDAVG